MAKAVTHAVESVRRKTLGMDRKVLRIACDEGSTYVFEASLDHQTRWEPRERIDRDGSRNTRPTRLPATIRAHMDGRTCSGQYGPDSDEYWTT